VSFQLTSQAKRRVIRAQLWLPSAGIPAQIKLRLRSPTRTPIERVLLNGQPWDHVDVPAEVITIPAGTGGVLTIEAQYAG
jgi:hypothetical protein